jgi:hypothetical protein
MDDCGEGTARREARWFVAGGLPGSLRPAGAPLRRVDAYQRSSLLPWNAVKRRGRSILEHKVRVGAVELVDVAGITGFGETWVKRRPSPTELDGGWLEVSKRVWTFREVELAVVEVEGRTSWTVCVDLERQPTRTGQAVLERWHGVLRRRGEPVSYPTWLRLHVLRTAGDPV